MRRPEWPTVALMIATYALWALATTWAAALWLPLSVVLAALAIAQHSSLSHEALHGHPFADARANAAAIWPALGLWVPYYRFRDTHLAHHRDALLTDPYDDPESNYLDPVVWARLPPVLKAALRFNNTLLGRLIIGPVIGMAVFLRADWRAIRAGDAGIRRAWALHGLAVLPVLAWIWAAPMPIWAYLMATYGAMSLLKIRTFLEHRAHERARGRSVVIEDRGPLALLFLNNNYHAVHHAHPQVPWYELPRVYARNRAHYLRRNDGYVYSGYGAIFRDYFLRAKDSVAHPLWPRP
ncbi:Fatty acid desaturase [Roseovarius nanhaiticus]|uniref:Fatty acid desaturase n=1 Tax=Roseovarius nanhaiticus TaxID=573024 RepID=A0A1N7FFV8_9RHOB|nr:fatty acid desaturase [Roseovarius nanhaiticus]SEK55582.1 Fatty acid desaturase [Roseovarius nanhaiticus]SIR99174.1 Fatty acid desaturase [Roseovarius nanhaiticus]